MRTHNRHATRLFVAIAATLGVASAVKADPALDCQAIKIKAYGERVDCRAKERARQLLGMTPDFAKCDAKLVDRLAKADAEAAQAGSACPRFVDGGDSTVLDLETGLMWEQKSPQDGVADATNPNDADNLYNWFDAMGDFVGRMNGVAELTTPITGAFAGYSNWRLPSIDELRTIVLEPCVDVPHCYPPELGPGAFFWSGTPWVQNPENLAVSNNVFVDNTPKLAPLRARAVRDAF